MRSILIITLSIALTGCFSNSRSVNQLQIVTPKHSQVLVPNTARPLAPPAAEIRLALEQQYMSWAGTPYRLGGADRAGIDCSAFVREVFGDIYNVQLPRSTDEQVTLGKEIARQELKPSDLIFFKTGRTQRHVGIYLGEGKFLHASTSRGVIISKLDNPYWKRNYWTARRAEEVVQLASL